MRRKEREVIGFDNIVDILAGCEVLHLGLCKDNRPYVVPVNFGYEAVAEKLYIYFHGAKEGRKIDMLRDNQDVCFETDCGYKTLEADKACNWSAEFKSVIGEGRANILTNEEDIRHGLDLIMKHYGAKGEMEYPSKVLQMTAVVRIEADQLSGKMKIK